MRMVCIIIKKFFLYIDDNAYSMLFLMLRIFNVFFFSTAVEFGELCKLLILKGFLIGENLVSY